MKYQTNSRQDMFEAKLSERITFSDPNDFRNMLKSMTESHSDVNIMDLSDVEYIDTAGLGMLMLARNELSKTSSRLTLRSPQGQVRRMFHIARFDKMFDIVKTP